MTNSQLNNKSLIQTNVDALKEGAQLIGLLEPEQYTKGFEPAFQSTIGAHFRHVLEHYLCFLKQMPSGQICYDDRDREQVFEYDSQATTDALAGVIEQLEQISDLTFEQTYFVVDQQAPEPVTTNLQRELLFLQSHTVHHYAIIAAMTRAFGNQPQGEFGVAIATRSHQKCNESLAVANDEPRPISNTVEA